MYIVHYINHSIGYRMLGVDYMAAALAYMFNEHSYCGLFCVGSQEVEDSDQLTDLFHSLFGRQCSVSDFSTCHLL